MSTYCHHLWETVTIDHKGDIFHCCKIKPLNLGSIYGNRLEEVLNRDDMREIRENSLHGSLPCYASCNLIEKNDLPGESCSAVCRYENLTSIYLDFGMKCNINCIMCKQREKYKMDKRGITCSILKKNVDFTPFRNIYIQGGEPLYIDECLEFMDYLHSIGKKYSLLTNGLLITDEMAEKLSQDAALVSISLNAATKKTHETVNKGSCWETVLGNVAKLRTCREKNGSGLLINGRMTITTAAVHEIPQFLSSFEKMGFDTANFGYDADTVPHYLETNPQLKEKLQRDIRDALLSLDTEKIDLLRLKQLDLIA